MYWVLRAFLPIDVARQILKPKIYKIQRFCNERINELQITESYILFKTMLHQTNFETIEKPKSLKKMSVYSTE